jgi:uncharacterized repeat protein (TIGR03803 family)
MTSRNECHDGRSGRNRRVASGALSLALVFLWASVGVRAQEKSTYAVLHTFSGEDGENPQAALIRDHEGNLYGTTFGGGDLSKCGGVGCGVVFRLDRSSKETVLYRFEAGLDGAGPAANLLRDQRGNLYSTTHGGGDVNGCFFEQGVPWSGCGVVFKVDPNTHTETTLYSFRGSTDGGGPSSGLVQDRAGNLYGTTVFGGDLPSCSFYGLPGCGVVYKLDPDGRETVLHAFSGGADGLAAYGDLLLDQKGNLFGAADNGGDTTSPFCGGIVSSLTGLAGCGTVFQIDRGGRFSVLHTFQGTDGGPYPDGWLVRDQEGNLYGMTGNGGNLSDCSGLGCGVVFKLDQSGKETVLHSFTGSGTQPATCTVLHTTEAISPIRHAPPWEAAASCSSWMWLVMKPYSTRSLAVRMGLTPAPT